MYAVLYIYIFIVASTIVKAPRNKEILLFFLYWWGGLLCNCKPKKNSIPQGCWYGVEQKMKNNSHRLWLDVHWILVGS